MEIFPILTFCAVPIMSMFSRFGPAGWVRGGRVGRSPARQKIEICLG